MKSKFEEHIISEVYIPGKEKTRVKQISYEEAHRLLDINCEKSIESWKNEQGFISRISDSAYNTKIGFFDSSKLPPRKSLNTLNYYTLIINNDPSWSSYPKRQVIGTSGYSTSSSEDVYVIFPYDRVKVGVCSSDDMWSSFELINKRSKGEMADSFNEFLNKLLNEPYASGSKKFDSGLGELKSACKKFDKWFAKMNNEWQEWLNSFTIGSSFFIKNNIWFIKDLYKGDLYKSLLSVYNPKGFKLFNSVAGLPKTDHEVWFDGPAVYINSQWLEEGNFEI